MWSEEPGRLCTPTNRGRINRRGGGNHGGRGRVIVRSSVRGRGHSLGVVGGSNHCIVVVGRRVWIEVN